MKIASIKLKNYRNYSDLSISLSSGLNVLVGDNAQGKTNLAEAIFLCAIGKSMRTNRDRDLILWDKEFARVDLSVENKGRKNISIYLFPNKNKSIKINGIPILKMGELLGNFNAVYFSPDELKLIKDSPDERRRFMDIDLSQFDRNYFYALSRYNKILSERNKLLKTVTSEADLHRTLPIWNEQLAKTGAYIVYSRLKFIDKLKDFAAREHDIISKGKETLKLSYTGVVGQSVDEITSKLLLRLEESTAKDIELRYTTTGPHRDDIKITLNDIDVRYYGSQGQQRSTALSLKLAELEIFRAELGTYPVLILDDVLSELDEERKHALLDRIQNIQTILTCTHFEYDVPCTKYLVNAGKITKTTN